MRNQKTKSVNPNSLPRVRPADVKKQKQKKRRIKNTRAFSIFELLVTIAIISLVLSFIVSLQWSDTKARLNQAEQKNQAMQELWLQRIEQPIPEYGIWEWLDEHDQTWIMYRDGRVEVQD